MRKIKEFIYIVASKKPARTRTAKRRRSSEISPIEPPTSEAPESPQNALSEAVPPPTVVPPPAPEYTRPDYLRMFGATAPDGAPWIQVQVDCDEGPVKRGIKTGHSPV